MRLFIAMAISLSAPFLSAAQKVTVDDLMRLRTVTDSRISPDGKEVAYVVSTPTFETAAHEGVLYKVPFEGATPIRLTYQTRIFNRPLPASWLRWSPDGSLISFIGYADGVPQVFAMAASGGEAWAITSVPGGVARYEWAPDGKQIAFTTVDAPSEEEVQRKKDKSFVIHVDKDPHPPRLWLQEVGSKVPHVISPAAKTVLDFGWAPDGKNLAYSASDQLAFNAPYNSGVFVISAAGGEPRAIVQRPGTNRLAKFSPDGHSIAFISSGGRAGMMNAQDLFVIAADGSGAPIGLTVAKEVWVSEYAWASDSRSLFYIPNERTNESGEHMFEQAIYHISVSGDKSEVVTPPRTVNYSLSFSTDGKRLAYRSMKSRTMGDIAAIEFPDSRARTLTDINPELRNWKLGKLEPVSWKSFDGMEIWGLLLTPPDYQKGQRFPLLVYCHGGPIGGYTYGIFPQFAHIPGQVDPYPVEAMASAGIAVFFPMPRGGSGYGIAGFRAIIKSWGETDYKDIMTGVDAMIARGIADPDRLGVMGASYGGYMTDWIVTQTKRFKAASTAASVSDLTNMYYFSDAGDTVVEYFDYPWKDESSLIQHSAITFVQDVSTPLLIQHGENDMRVPLSQAQEFYKALKDQHKVVEFDIYPRGGHVNFEPPQEKEYMLRNLAWFEKWLKPNPVSH